MEKETEIQDFLERIKTPINKIGIKELRERESTWRALWSWTPDEVKYYILRVGSTMRVLKIDYKGSVGELGAVKFRLDELELMVYEKVYNYSNGKEYFEEKVLRIPANAIKMQEFILSSEMIEQTQPEVMGLEVEALLGG